MSNTLLLALNLPLIGIWVACSEYPHRYCCRRTCLFHTRRLHAQQQHLRCRDRLCARDSGLLHATVRISGSTHDPGRRPGSIIRAGFRRAMAISGGDPTVFLTPSTIGCDSVLSFRSYSRTCCREIYFGTTRPPPLTPPQSVIKNEFLSPAFLTSVWCSAGHIRHYCVALGRAPRRTVKYACGAPRRAPCHEGDVASPPGHNVAWSRFATTTGEKCGLGKCCRYSSEVGAVCGSSRTYASVRWVPGDPHPYRET